MIVILKPDADLQTQNRLIDWIRSQNVEVQLAQGQRQTALCLLGDTEQIDAEQIAAWRIVDAVKRVSEPFRRSGRRAHPQDTVITVGTARLGGGHFCLIAGPCSVETEEQIVALAKAVKASGAQMLRGGVFKPRTSPYDFQGLQDTGMALLKLARQETGLPIVTEIMGIGQLPLFADVDVIQIGARNMQNVELLRAVGQMKKPVLLKRGLCATLRELLLSAEYLMTSGAEQVILCERGIRTFDDYTRNTLDLAVVPMLHELTHLPVIVDPSHATGAAALVAPMALAAAAGGADGLMIEVHDDPVHAKSDGAQALRPKEFDALARRVFAVREAARG